MQGMVAFQVQGVLMFIKHEPFHGWSWQAQRHHNSLLPISILKTYTKAYQTRD